MSEEQNRIMHTYLALISLVYLCSPVCNGEVKVNSECCKKYLVFALQGS